MGDHIKPTLCPELQALLEKVWTAVPIAVVDDIQKEREGQAERIRELMAEEADMWRRHLSGEDVYVDMTRP